MKPLKLNSFLCLAIICLIYVNACTIHRSSDLEEAKKLISLEKFEHALTIYDTVVKKDVKSEDAQIASKEGAKLAYIVLKNPSKALYFYENLSLYAKNNEDRLLAQKEIANIVFNDIGNYERAIVEYSKLLGLPHSLSEEIEYKMAISRSYYYLGNFEQSLSELDELIYKKYSGDKIFDIYTLKANTLLAKKKYQAASEIYLKLLADYEVRSLAENIVFSLVICYEELNQFDKAIELLNSVKVKYDQKEYIELRIAKIQQRKMNQPGSKGKFRK